MRTCSGRTGSQTRAMVHLTMAKTAVPAFARAVKDAMRAGTVIAGRVLSTQQKDDAAVTLFNLFAGRSLTAREMVAIRSEVHARSGADDLPDR